MSVTRLTEGQNERLALLLEECGEVIQIIGKIQRHGLFSSDPTKPGGPDNQDLLAQEIADVVQAIDLLAAAKDINTTMVEVRLKRRWITVQKYLHFQPEELFRDKP